ncbi:MAG: demethoxyubiquinone hydroxylase family protein [Alphaproteobacteria bacterium]|nr:MAG: demethoxyubiquinone hydroxylase family protein [Alphaproteobacteria bacterium]
MTAASRRHKTADRVAGERGETARLHRLLRVDQAGEFGATRIYAGQLAVLRRKSCAPVIQEMAQQEDEHLSRFDDLMRRHHVRPTALRPLWHVAGFALGAATALLGERAAMACTAAVEEEIDQHYARQIRSLENPKSDLGRLLEKFRQDESQHRATALAHGAEQAPAWPLLRRAIRAGTRAAIALSERV